MDKEAEEYWQRCWREAGRQWRLKSLGEGSAELVGRIFECREVRVVGNPGKA